MLKEVGQVAAEVAQYKQTLTAMKNVAAAAGPVLHQVSGCSNCLHVSAARQWCHMCMVM